MHISKFSHMEIFFLFLLFVHPSAMRQRPDGTFLTRKTFRLTVDVMCVGKGFSCRVSGTVLQEVQPPGRGGAGGERQHADARRDRLLVERGRVEAVHHRTRVEPQHRRHPCVQQQGSVHKQVHHQHGYVSIICSRS